MDDLLDIDAKLHINCIRFIQHLIENNTSQTDVATAVVVQVGWIVRVFNEYSIALENIPRPLPVVKISHQVLEKCLGNIWKKMTNI